MNEGVVIKNIIPFRLHGRSNTQDLGMINQSTELKNYSSNPTRVKNNSEFDLAIEKVN